MNNNNNTNNKKLTLTVTKIETYYGIYTCVCRKPKRGKSTYDVKDLHAVSCTDVDSTSHLSRQTQHSARTSFVSSCHTRAPPPLTHTHTQSHTYATPSCLFQFQCQEDGNGLIGISKSWWRHVWDPNAFANTNISISTRRTEKLLSPSCSLHNVKDILRS